MDTVLQKARKLIALINHEATESHEKQAATQALQRIMQSHGLTMEQLLAHEEVQGIYIPLNQDDQQLIKQCIFVVLGVARFGFSIRRSDGAIYVDLTEAQHILLSEMLRHYRHEYSKSLINIDAEIAKAKKALADARKSRKVAMKGFIQVMKIFPEILPDSKASNKTYSEEEIKSIYAAMRQCSQNRFTQPQQNLPVSESIN
jgi:hypothetical protein